MIDLFVCEMVEPGECLLCFEGYNAEDKNHHPLILSCGHTLCAGCYALVSAQEGTDKVECPICKQVDTFGEPVLNTTLTAWAALTRDLANASVDVCLSFILFFSYVV